MTDAEAFLPNRIAVSNDALYNLNQLLVVVVLIEHQYHQRIKILSIHLIP